MNEQQKTKWFVKFLNKSRSLASSPEDLEKSNLISDVLNKILSHKSSFKEVWELLQASIRMLKAWVKGEYRDVSYDVILKIVVVLIYILSPLDFIPDPIPFIGFTDDAGFALWGLKSIREEINRFIEWERS